MKLRLIFLVLGMFTMGCSSYLIAGLLPGLSETLEASLAAVAQGIAAFGVAYAVGSPIFAVLLAGKPARRVLLLALVVFLIGNVMTFMSTNLPVYLFSRVITGVGAGLFSPICVAVAVQWAGAEARGRALSTVWGANSAGAVLGVPSGLWLAQQAGWQAAIAGVLSLAVISLLGILWQRADFGIKAPPTLTQRLRLLADHRVLVVIGVTAVTAMASLGLYSYSSVVLKDSTHSLSTALFVWSLGGLIGSHSVGHFIDRTGKPREVMAVILGGLVFCFLLLPHVLSLPFIGLLPVFVWGAMGWATVAPQQHTLIGLQPEQSATLAALNGSALSLGGVLGTAAGGMLIAGGVSAQILPYTAAAILLIVFVGQWILIQKMPQKANA